MLKINKILAFEYDFEYDFKRMERKYSEVRIFDANGDLSKRWYIYFSYRNPATGKLERQPLPHESFRVVVKKMASDCFLRQN